MNGSFEICSKCKEKINCCVDFGSIDNPIISNSWKLNHTLKLIQASNLKRK